MSDDNKERELKSGDAPLDSNNPVLRKILESVRGTGILDTYDRDYNRGYDRVDYDRTYDKYDRETGSNKITPNEKNNTIVAKGHQPTIDPKLLQQIVDTQSKIEQHLSDMVAATKAKAVAEPAAESTKPVPEKPAFFSKL